MDVRSPVSIVTREELYPKVLQDLWFTDNPFFSRVREKVVPFTGGKYSTSKFRYRPMPAQFYQPGATLTLVKVDTLGELNFGLKSAITHINEYKQDLQVYNKGPLAMFSLLDEHLENALSSIEQMIAIQMWTNSGSDPTAISGLSEGIGNGLVPSWDGYIAPTYGGATRNGNYGNILNGNIHWWGNSDGTLGEVTRPKFNYLYSKCKKGKFEVDLILSSKLGYTLIENKLESQYRYTSEEVDPYWGGRGVRFKNALILEDEYMPSADGLTNDQNYNLGGYQTSSFANPLSTATGTFPNSSNAPTLYVGEVYFFLNSNFWWLRLSDDPEFAFGFSGFMRTPDNPSKITGEIKAELNFQTDGSKYQGMGYGVGS